MKKILSLLLVTVICCLSFTSVLGEVLLNATIEVSAADNSYKRLTLSTNTTGPRYHIDGNGNPVHLFGMARCQSHASEEEEDQGGTVNTLARHYAELGANYMRLAIKGLDIYGTSIDDPIRATDAEIDEFITKYVDPDVQAIIGEGMYVGLDLHMVSLTGIDTSSGMTADKVLAFAKANFTPFLKRLALYYKDEPMVANIELWNEPSIGVPTGADGMSWADALREYYIYTIKEVRKIDSTRILMVSDYNAGWGFAIDDFWKGHYAELGDNVVHSAHVSDNEFDVNGSYSNYGNWALNVADTRNICIFYNEVENEPSTSTDKSIQNFVKFMEENKNKYHLSACLWRPHEDYIEKPQIWATNGWAASYTGGTLKLAPAVLWFRTNGGSTSDWVGESVTFKGNGNTISSTGASISHTREFVKIKNFTENIIFTKNNRTPTDLTGYEYVVVKMKFSDKSVAETALAATSGSPFITLEDGATVSFSDYKAALLTESGNARLGDYVTLILPLSKKLSGCYTEVSVNLGYKNSETHFYTVDFVTKEYAQTLKDPNVDIYADKKLDFYDGPDYTMKGVSYYPQLSMGVKERFVVNHKYTTIRMKLRMPNYNTLKNSFTNGGRYSVGGGSFTYGDDNDLAIHFLGDGVSHIGVTKIRFRDILKNYASDLAAGKTVTVEFPICGTFIDGGVIESMHFMLAHDSRTANFAGESISVFDVEFLTDSMYLQSKPEYEFIGNENEPQLKIDAAYGIRTSDKYHSVKFDISFPDVAKLRDYMKTGSDLSVDGGSFSNDSAKDYALYFTGDNIGTVGVTQKEMFNFFNQYEEELAAGETLTVTFPLEGAFNSYGVIKGLNIMLSNGEVATNFDKQLIYISNLEFVSGKELKLDGGPEFSMISGWYEPQLETTIPATAVNSKDNKIRINIALENAAYLINNMSTGSGSTIGGGSWSYYEGDLAIYFTGQNVNGIGITQGDLFEFLRDKKNKAALDAGKTLTATFNIGGTFPDDAVITGMKMYVTHPSSGAYSKDHDAFNGKKIYLSDMEFVQEGKVEEKIANTTLKLKNGPDYKFVGYLWEPQLVVETEPYYAFSDIEKIRFDLKMPAIETLRPNMSWGSKGGGSSYDGIKYGPSDFAIYFGGIDTSRVGITQEQFYAALDENKVALSRGETVSLEFDLSGTFTDNAEIRELKMMIAHDSKASAFDGCDISVSNVIFVNKVTQNNILKSGPQYSFKGAAWGPQLTVKTKKAYVVSSRLNEITFDIKLPDYATLRPKMKWGSVGGGKTYDEIAYSDHDFGIYFTGTDVGRVGVAQIDFIKAIDKYSAALKAGETVTLRLPLTGSFVDGGIITAVNVMLTHGEDAAVFNGMPITLTNVDFVRGDSNNILEDGPKYTLGGHEWYPQLTVKTKELKYEVSSDFRRIKFDIRIPDYEILRPLMSSGSRGGGINFDAFGVNNTGYVLDAFGIYFSGVSYVGITQRDLYAAFDANKKDLSAGKKVTLTLPITGSFADGDYITALNLMVTHGSNAAEFEGRFIAISGVEFLEAEVEYEESDLNCDETVNAVDLTILKRVLWETSVAIINKNFGDVNGDGLIDILDYIVLRKAMLG